MITVKKCPYCGHMNEDESRVCDKCFAGFPHEEKILADSTKENSVKSRENKRKKELNTDGT